MGGAECAILLHQDVVLVDGGVDAAAEYAEVNGSDLRAIRIETGEDPHVGLSKAGAVEGV